MGTVRSAASVLLALAISLSITGAFVLGSPLVPTGPTTQAYAADGTPAPFAPGITQTGEPPEAVGAFPQFDEVAAAVGFVYEPSVPTGIEIVNSGVYIADINNNGYEDILAVGEEYPILFQNVGGEYVPYRTFTDSRVQAAHFFDFNNDGFEDLLLAQYGGELIFYENVHGTFVRADVGFDGNVVNPSSIVAADFTGNGCLDVFITQNGLWSGTTPLTHAAAQRVAAEHPDVRPQSESGKPDLLYYSDCETVTDVTEQAGIHGRTWGLTSSAADFTGNGYPDIHVGNDWSEDHLYVNNGDGTFTRKGLGPDSDRNAMSSNAIDLSGDLRLDLFVTNIYYDENSTRTERAPPLNRDAALPLGNNYFENDGTGNFTDRAVEHGLEKGGWGWTATIADLSNDGHLDIVQTTTNVYWIEPYSNAYASLQLWKGTHDSWEKLSSRASGLHAENTYSIARVDYDNDGHLDLVVGTAPLGPTLREHAQPFKLFENQQEGDDYVQFFVRDPDVIDRNAAVYIETDKRVIFDTPNARGNFQTQDSRLIHVGLQHEELERVTVLWPDGTETEYHMLETGNRYILSQSGVEEVP